MFPFKKRNAALNALDRPPEKESKLSVNVPVRVILVAVIGIGVAIGSWFYLQDYLIKNQKMEMVYVPAIDIPPYTTISQEYITQRRILAGAREPNAAVTSQELVGKMPTTVLYRGEQVRRERLINSVDMNRPEVTISIDPVRLNGAKPGDVVDLYFTQGENTPGALLAADVIVKSLRDGNGSDVSTPQLQIPGAQAQAPKVASMVMLSVKPEEVPNVVRGASSGSKSIVLVRKRG